MTQSKGELRCSADLEGPAAQAGQGHQIDGGDFLDPLLFHQRGQVLQGFRLSDLLAPFLEGALHVHFEGQHPHAHRLALFQLAGQLQALGHRLVIDAQARQHPGHGLHVVGIGVLGQPVDPVAQRLRLGAHQHGQALLLLLRDGLPGQEPGEQLPAFRHRAFLLRRAPLEKGPSPSR